MKISKIRTIALSLSLLSILLFTSCDQLDEIVGPELTDSEIVEGLKAALNVGLGNSVTSASSVDGYLQNQAIQILLPDEVKSFQNQINNDAVLKTAYDVYVVSFNSGNDIFDELITAMNRGAENAADKALPIFGDAITSMTFQDARGILEGGERSATDFFENETSAALVTAFAPDVKTALDGTGAIELFGLISGFLNQEITFGITVNDFVNVNLPDNIEEYATGKAVDGMFYLVGEEEKKIRANPAAWGSDIIERVFGSIL